MVRRLNEEAAEKRRKIDIQRMAEEKAAGRTTNYEGRGDDSEASWGRGTNISEAKKNREEMDNRMRARVADRERPLDDAAGFAKGNNVNKVEVRT